MKTHRLLIRVHPMLPCVVRHVNNLLIAGLLIEKVVHRSYYIYLYTYWGASGIWMIVFNKTSLLLLLLLYIPKTIFLHMKFQESQAMRVILHNTLCVFKLHQCDGWSQIIENEIGTVMLINTKY